MANNPKEKMFGAEIPTSLCDDFMAMCEDMDCKKKVALRAAVKLWLSIPESMQVGLLNQKIETDAFIAIIESVVLDLQDRGIVPRVE